MLPKRYSSNVYSPVADIQPPATLTIAVTDLCNLACSHCWVARDQHQRISTVPEWSLLQIIEQYASLGGKHIRFTGGEPLLHPGWMRTIQFAETIGIPTITLQTNATLLTTHQLVQLTPPRLPGLKIQISLDGATPASHDAVRGCGSFDATQKSLKRLVLAGCAGRITINFTEMRHNLGEFPALLELADKLGLASVTAGTLIQGGRASCTPELLPPEPEQYLQLLELYETDPYFRSRYSTLGSMAAIEWRRGEAPRSECCNFSEHHYLTADGRLYPCLLLHSDDYAVHGVYEKGLQAALREGLQLWEPLLQISRQRFESLHQCKTCPGSTVCAGGCMGRAISNSGSPWQADDRCKQRAEIYAAYPPDIWKQASI